MGGETGVGLAAQHYRAAGIDRGDGLFPGGGEHRSRRLDVGQDIVLGARRGAREIADPHGTVHTHEPGPVGDARRPPKRLGDVGQGADGQDHGRLRRRIDGLDQGQDSVGVDGGVGVKVAGVGPAALGPALHGGGHVQGPTDPQADGHVAPSGYGQHPGTESAAIVRLAAHRGDEFQVQLGAGQQHGQGPGVVDIGADVSVEEDGDGHGQDLSWGTPRGWRTLRRVPAPDHPFQATRSSPVPARPQLTRENMFLFCSRHSTT